MGAEQAPVTELRAGNRIHASRTGACSPRTQAGNQATGEQGGPMLRPGAGLSGSAGISNGDPEADRDAGCSECSTGTTAVRKDPPQPVAPAVVPSEFGGAREGEAVC